MAVSLLESRVFLSATVSETVKPTAITPTSLEPIDEGVVIIRSRTDASQINLRAGESLQPNAQLNGNGLQFNLIAASGMSQQAIDGFQAAADLWSSILRDDILVNINIDFTTLGAGILGSTGSTSQGNSLSSVKTALASDATSLSDAIAVANLPAGSSLSIYTSDATTGAAEIDNNGTANNTILDLNTANAKALGLRSASDAAADGSITFSSAFTWDFDRSNGITAGAYDFVGVAAHEIGHLLGFVSGADTVDYYSHNGSGAPTELDPYRVASTLDLFRRSAASETAGTDIDLRADTATKYFSIDGGTTQLTTFSTGVENGDGRQCSHWKDNLNIGIMDPTAANGEYTDITNLDIQAFDVMGWNVAMDLGDAPDTGAGTGTGNYQTNLSDGGARHMLFSASGSISDPSGAPKVYLGAGVTRELTALQNSNATGDTDNGISGIPTLNPGATQSFTVNSTGNNAILNYFFDFNRDGDFVDSGEAFTTTLTSSSQSVSVVVPMSATTGTTFARFRISTAGGLSAVGAANDGEVEDYQVTIQNGGGNNAPVIGGAAANQAVNDDATVSPFSSLTVTDADTQAMFARVTISNGVNRGDFTLASSSGWTRTVNGADLVYTRSFSTTANIGATVQSAIRSLVFQPRRNAIPIGSTEMTGFSVFLNDQVANTTNSGTSVITTSVNDAPTIGGAVAGQAVNDDATINPFSSLTVTDGDTQAMFARVTISNGVNRGDFTSASSTGWSRVVNGADIVYTRSFATTTNIGATVQSAIRAFVFQPRSNVIPVGASETTGFTVFLNDQVAYTANGGTTVVATNVNNVPTIGGAVAGQAVNDNATISPFASMTVTDGDTQAMFARVTISNGVNRGDFTSASRTGWTRTVNGNDIVYTRSFGTTANIGATVQAAIRTFVFQPRSNAIPLGATETTGFIVFLNDQIANTTNSSTTVVTTNVNEAPTIGGAIAGQAVNDNTTIGPFSSLTVTDGDTQAMFSRVTISNGVNRGDFTSASRSGWTRTVNGADIVYTRSFSTTVNIGNTVQTAIRALVFQPRTSVLAPGATETTQFIVLVNDGVAYTSNGTTTVITTGVASRVT